MHLITPGPDTDTLDLSVLSTPRARVPITLARRHKTALHVCLILLICLSLLHEGGGLADWLFLVMCVVVEIA